MNTTEPLSHYTHHAAIITVGAVAIATAVGVVNELIKEKNNIERFYAEETKGTLLATSGACYQQQHDLHNERVKYTYIIDTRGEKGTYPTAKGTFARPVVIRTEIQYPETTTVTNVFYGPLTSVLANTTQTDIAAIEKEIHAGTNHIARNVNCFALYTAKTSQKE